VSVEGVDSIFCAKDQICVADIKDGKCPDAQADLPYGSYCDKVKTGVYGCKPKTKEMVEQAGAPAQCNGEGESPMSVEGVEGVFCVKGQACVADIKDGACPGPQKGLEFGAECGKVKTGVYGCKPKSKDQPKPEEKPAGKCTGPGESPMSVEGVEGIFCVTGQACVADIKDGACPGKQDGLPNGAVCGKVKTGVYGCKPAGASDDYGDDDDSDSDSDSDSYDAKCGKGESPMSVEGVEGIFCVKGQACVADIKDGACPGPTEGLQYGAECGVVKTGVYGCKPKSKPEEKPVEKPAGKCTGPGESPMSVEGVEGIFCVTGQACVADIKDGACPGPQDGLKNGAECGVVQSGVYGCKPKAAKKHRKSHSVKVVKSHAKKTHKKH
jgi:hypothetical protein